MAAMRDPTELYFHRQNQNEESDSFTLVASSNEESESEVQRGRPTHTEVVLSDESDHSSNEETQSLEIPGVKAEGRSPNLLMNGQVACSVTAAATKANRQKNQAGDNAWLWLLLNVVCLFMLTKMASTTRARPNSINGNPKKENSPCAIPDMHPN